MSGHGIRRSERPEDYRTEVLGLVKAQPLKNAVIVPQGVKGAFIAKRLPATGGCGDLAAEVRAWYLTIARGLLDVADNLVDGAVVSPPAVVSHDVPHPCLVAELLDLD